MTPDARLKTGDDILLDVLSNIQTIRYSELASSTIIIFEHLITLEQEYNLIWRAPWSFGKCLFLINRYYTLLTVIFNNYALFSHTLSDSVSLHWFRWQGWTGVTSFIIAELLLLMRLYALYFLNKRVLIFMATSSILAFAATAGIMGSVLSQITATARSFPTHPTPFCAALNLPTYSYAFWLPMLFSECILCALAVSRFVHMHRTRAGATLFQNGRHLVQALIRDSVWYFVVMFATYLANTIVFVVGTTTEIEIPIGFSVAFACVLANRLCLNTRGMIRRSSSRSAFSMTDSSPSSQDAYSYPPRQPHTHTNDDLESWEDGLGSDAEDAEYDGDAEESSGQHIVSTPARTIEVEIGSRLGAIQMLQLRQMRSSRRLGERWGSGRGWIGAGRQGAGDGVVTV